MLAVQEPSFRVLATRSKVHSNPICAMMVDPQTNQLVSASRNGEVIIWDEYAKLLHRYATISRTLCHTLRTVTIL